VTLDRYGSRGFRIAERSLTLSGACGLIRSEQVWRVQGEMGMNSMSDAVLAER